MNWIKDSIIADIASLDRSFAKFQAQYEKTALKRHFDCYIASKSKLADMPYGVERVDTLMAIYGSRLRLQHMTWLYPCIEDLLLDVRSVRSRALALWYARDKVFKASDAEENELYSQLVRTASEVEEFLKSVLVLFDEFADSESKQ